MPSFVVTFEDVAYLSVPSGRDPLEFNASEYELAGFSEVARREGVLFPEGVSAVVRAAATPDDSLFEAGRDESGDVKLFVSIDLLVEAPEEDAAERMNPPVHLLTRVADLLSPEFAFENAWEAVCAEPAEVQAPAP